MNPTPKDKTTRVWGIFFSQDQTLLSIYLSRKFVAQADRHQGRENLRLGVMKWLGLGFDSRSPESMTPVVDISKVWRCRRVVDPARRGRPSAALDSATFLSQTHTPYFRLFLP